MEKKNSWLLIVNVALLINVNSDSVIKICLLKCFTPPIFHCQSNSKFLPYYKIMTDCSALRIQKYDYI